MGHAGAWAAPGEPDARAKMRALEDAGAVIVNHPENFGEGMKMLLSNKGRRSLKLCVSLASAVGEHF
jgi:succinyl-CoA synthetase alpha subunit